MIVEKIQKLLRLIKFSHTLFALPFALSSMLVASRGLPPLRTTLLILLAMVGARTAAMAFNRYADWDYDRVNPRTKERAELATRTETLILCGAGLAIFFAASAALNRVCLLLAPLAACIFLGYSLTKRFTPFSHAFLGLALALAPLGAWAAVRQELASPIPYLLALAVFFWTFGFDLVYATLDVSVDQKLGLYSFPACFGVRPSLVVAIVLHGLAWIAWSAFGMAAHLSWPYFTALLAVSFALAYEHLLCSSGDPVRVQHAFFHVNSAVSLLLFAGVALSLAIENWPW
ncbi:UbiA-like polyprenyltransferase [Candidatus Methylacidithermus pantelleriae]|uniref:4-hydroxybenzoate polyprenyltransferase n=1 Tax=Candidatus Methylacidithermus pantelleriae TaxID=2744239 RepID=A0A8J2FN73_9BACT|nr:UbiA-like polyprenyltransferase [Candidatus Methylacidithermus pantelleriae]CAF0693624.1 4-hydroxybenzoate polyprenyltransferase [Candidatus Methylacidithermus pantelleriae]